MTRSTAAANNANTADQDGPALQQQQQQQQLPPQGFQLTPDNITAIASALANNPAFSQGLGASILNAGGDAALLQAVTKRVADTYEERDARKRQRTEQLLLIQPDGPLLEHIQKGTDPSYTLAKLFHFATASAFEPGEMLAVESGGLKLTTKIAPIKDQLSLFWAMESHGHILPTST
jgi:hypothetical protein